LWILTFFGRSAEVANQYLRKGSKILVDGRLNFEQWTDKQSGQKRSKHSVIVETMQMLDSKLSNEDNNNSNYNQQQQPQQGYNNQQQPQQGYNNQQQQQQGYNTPQQQQQ